MSFGDDLAVNETKSNVWGDSTSSDIVPRRTNKDTLAGLFAGVDGWDAVLSPDALNAVDSSLTGSTDKKSGRMRAANIALLSDRFGRSADEVSGMYDQFKDSFAKTTLKSMDPLDDAGFYAKAGEYLKKEGEESAMLAGMATGLFAEVKGGQPFNQAYAKLEAANSAAPGWDPTRADYYRTLARRQYEAFTEKSAALAEPIARVGAFMKLAASGVAPGESDKVLEQHAAVIDLLGTLSPDDASLVMEFAAGNAKPATKEKGTLEKTAQALDRGIANLGRKFVGAGQDIGRRIGGAIAGDEFAAGQDRRRTQIERELDAKIAGEVDTLKGESWLENMTVTTAESIPALASFLSLPGIIANGIATKEELRGQYEDGGLSANAADAVSAIAAVPMTAINFVSSKMVFGKVPGAGKLFEPITAATGLTIAGLAKRAGAVAAVELPVQVGLAEIQQALPSGVQALAGVMNEQIPEVEWDKVFEGMKGAFPETLTSVIPLVLIGTGTATFKDRADGLAYIQNETRLRALGVKPQARAAIIAESSPETAVAMLEKALDVADSTTPDAKAAISELNAEVVKSTKEVTGVDHETVAVPQAVANKQAVADIVALTPDEFFKWSAERAEGFTIEAHRLGIEAIGNPDALADLKAGQEAAVKQHDAVREKIATSEGEAKFAALDELSAATGKTQFFREAIEAAENTGSAAGEARVKEAHERAGTLPRESIEGENPDPTEPSPADGEVETPAEAAEKARTPEQWATFDNSLRKIDRQLARLESGQVAERNALQLQRLELQAEAGIEGAGEALGEYQERVAAQEAEPDVDTAIRAYVQENPLVNPSKAGEMTMRGELRQLFENLTPQQRKDTFRNEGAADLDKYAQGLIDHLEAEGVLPEGSGQMTEAEVLDRIGTAFSTKREPVPIPRIDSAAPGAALVGVRIARNEAGKYLVSDAKGEIVGTATTQEMAAQIAIDHGRPSPVVEKAKPVEEVAKVPTLKEFAAKWAGEGVKTSVSEKNGLITLSRVVVPEEVRGQGVGSKFMKELTAYADASGQRVALTPSKDFGASSVGRLKEFYQRFGFFENKGKNKDFTVSESMLREPIAKTAEKPVEVVEKEAEPTPQPVKPTPEATQKPDPQTAALNKAEIKAVRELFDLDALPKPEREGFAKVLEDARAMVGAADGLADDVVANPRELDAREHAAMVLRAAELQNGYETLMNEAARDIDAGLPLFGEQKRRQAEALLDRLDVLTEASDRAGTEIGRALSIRRMRINRSTYELASIVQRATVAKRGKLTAGQAEEFRKLSESIKDQQAKIDSLEADLAEERLKLAKKDAETFVSEGRSVRATAGRLQNARRRTDLKKELVALGLRVNDITSSFGQGAEVASIVAKMARTYIEDGAATLAEVSEKLRADLPELTDSDIYNSLGGRIKSEQKRIESEAKARVRELQKQALLLAKIGDGLNQQKLDKKPSKDSPEVKALREQLAQLRLQADRVVTEDATLKAIHEKINAVQDQLATGSRPDPQAAKAAESEAIAGARKQLKDLLTERELVDQVAELDAKVKAGDISTARGEATPEANQRIAELRAQRDELRAKLDAIGAPERTADALIERMAERQAGAEDWPETKRNGIREAVAEQTRNPVDDAAFEAKLTAQGVNETQAATLAQLVRNDIEAIETDRAIRAEARTNPELVNNRRRESLETRIAEVEAELAGGFRAIPEKTSIVSDAVDVVNLRKSLSELESLMRTEDAISDLKEQIRTGDYKVSVPERRIIKSAKLSDAYVTKKQLEREVRQRIEALKPKTVKDKILEVALLPRSIMATADMSASLRQGAFLSARRPIVAAKTFVRSFQSFLSQNTADAIDIAIRSHPMQIERQRAKLFLSDLDVALNAKEEAFMSNLAAKIPLFGRLVKASERSMVTTLNLLRSASFDQFVRDHPTSTPEQRRAFADYVNVASGRGDLGSFNRAAKELSAVFFAPRWGVSRFQLLYSPFKNIKDPVVRNEIAKDFLAFGLTGMTVLGLAAAAGAKVGVDPESPDFGKIIIGNTRLDIWGGNQQVMRLLLSPILAGLDKAGIIASRKRINPLMAGLQFLAYKMSPSVTIPNAIVTGKDMVGNPVEIEDVVIRSITPLLTQEVWSVYQDTESLAAATAAGAATFVGVGVNTQKPKKK